MIKKQVDRFLFVYLFVSLFFFSNMSDAMERKPRILEEHQGIYNEILGDLYLGRKNIN